MSKTKRLVGLVLAGIILAGTLLGLAGMVVYAAEAEAEAQKPIVEKYVFYKQDSNGDIAMNGGAKVELSSVSKNAGTTSKRSMYTVELTVVAPNIQGGDQGGDKELDGFYANLLESNFYPGESNKGSLVEGSVGSDPVTGFLTYKLQFPNVLYDGEGKVMDFRLGYSYRGGDAADYEMSAKLSRAKLYVPPTDDDDDDDEDEDDETYEIATPYIVIGKYGYGGGTVVAGSQIPLSIEFYNTSPDIELENILMSVETSAGLSITSSSNTFYLENLGEGKRQSRSLPLTCSLTAAAGVETVSISFKYEYVLDKVRKTGETSEVIAIPVTQIDRFIVDQVEPPAQLWPGEAQTVYVNYVNKGKTIIYNLSAWIDGEIDEPRQLQNLGNVAAGDSGTIDFNIGSSVPGDLDCVIHITYENEEGDQTELTQNFRTNVMEMDWGQDDPGMVDPGMTDPGAMEPESGKKSPLLIAAFAVGALSMGGVTAASVILKAKAKREEAEDEDI